MNKLRAFLILIRAHNIIILWAAILVSCYLLNVALNLDVLKVMFITSTFMASGYIVNDIRDVKTDKINTKNRPLVLNTLTTQECKTYNIIFIIIGLVVSLYINNYAKALLYLIIIPLVYLYNYYFKQYIIIGNVVVALLLSMVFVFLEISLFNTFEVLLIPSLLTFGISLIREILKDIEDYKGDKASQMKTLPIILGKQQSVILTNVLIVVFVFLSTAYGVTTLSTENHFFILLIILIEIPLLYSLFLLLKLPTKKTFYNLVRLYKTITLNGLIVLLFMKGI